MRAIKINNCLSTSLSLRVLCFISFLRKWKYHINFRYSRMLKRNQWIARDCRLNQRYGHRPWTWARLWDNNQPFRKCGTLWKTIKLICVQFQIDSRSVTSANGIDFHPRIKSVPQNRMLSYVQGTKSSSDDGSRVHRCWCAIWNCVRERMN